MEKRNLNIFLNETQFTSVCKAGFITVGTNEGVKDINFSRTDIENLYNDIEVSKDEYSGIYNFLVDPKIPKEYRGEIIKRSPLYNELYNSLN